MTLRLSDATFARTSVAYNLSSNGTLSQVLANVPRTTPVLLASRSDGQLHTDWTYTDGATTYTRAPQCISNGKLLCVAENAGAFRGVHAWDGTSWTVLNASFHPRNIWLLPGSTVLLASKYDTTRYNLYYSENHGANWSLCELDAAPWVGSEAGVYFRGWELSQKSGGPYFIGEAGTNTRKLYRSADGINWTTVYTAPDDASGGVSNNHWHTIAYHKATGKWVACRGDSLLNRRILTSADAFATSPTDLRDANAGMGAQPIMLFDVGHPTELLSAEDSYRHLCWLNVNTGRTRMVNSNLDRRNSNEWSFLLFRHRGVWYNATFSTHATTGGVQTLKASYDLIHWTTVHRFAAGAGGAFTFAGEFNGRMYFTVLRNGNLFQDFQSFSMLPIRLRRRKAVLIEPPTTNLLNTASADHSAGGNWELTSVTRSSRSDSPVEGASYNRFSGTGATATIKLAIYQSTGTDGPIPNNQGYSLSGFIKGMFAEVQMYPYHREVTGVDSLEAMPTKYHGGAPYVSDSDNWQKLQHSFFLPIKATADGYAANGSAQADVSLLNCQFNLYAAKAAAYASDVIEYDLDAWQIEAGLPTTWQVVGTPRTAETLTWTETLGDNWSHLFAVHLPLTSIQIGLIGGTYEVCRYVKGSAYLRIAYTPSAAPGATDSNIGSWLLQTSANGTSWTTIATVSGATWAAPHHLVRFVVRRTATATMLSVDDGSGLTTATGTVSAVTGASSTIQYGGTGCLPILLSHNDLVNTFYSNSDLSSLFLHPLAVEHTFPSGGPVYVERVSATRLRTYTSVRYKGTRPQLPLWQIQEFRSNWAYNGHLTHRNAVTWQPLHNYVGQVICTTDHVDNWRTYTRADWTDSGGSSWTDFTTGSDDALVSGKPSNTFSRSSTVGGYAELAFTVPEGWDGAFVTMTKAWGNTWDNAGDTRMEIFDSTGKQVGLNGRGIIRMEQCTSSNFLRCRYWDGSGKTNQAANYTSTARNAWVEIARGLTPGNYTLRITHLTGSNLTVAKGRVIVHKPTYIIPGGTNWFLYFEEYPPKYAGSTSTAPYPRDPGPLQVKQEASTDEMPLRISSSIAGDENSGGPAHGAMWQHAAKWLADGVEKTLTADWTSNGTVYGPYTVVQLDVENSILRAIKPDGSTATTTSGNATVSLSATPDLSGIAAGDYIAIESEDTTDTSATYTQQLLTSGASLEGPGNVFIVASTGTGTVTLTSAPDQSLSGKAYTFWKADAPLVSVRIVYTITTAGIDYFIEGEWGGGAELGTGVCYACCGAYSQSGSASSHRPLHPTAVYPFDMTHLELRYLDRPLYNGKMPMSTMLSDLSAERHDLVIAHFENIEGVERREIGRLHITDIDRDNWIGVDNSATNTTKSYVLGSSTRKVYSTLLDTGSTAPANGDELKLRWSRYWTERDWFSVTSSTRVQVIDA